MDGPNDMANLTASIQHANAAGADDLILPDDHATHKQSTALCR